MPANKDNAPDPWFMARRKDPATSHAAAKHMADSGTADGQRKMVADLVLSNPGMTSRELSEISSLDRYQLARRLPEAEKKGWVHKGLSRVSPTTDLPAVTWWPWRE